MGGGGSIQPQHFLTKTERCAGQTMTGGASESFAAALSGVNAEEADGKQHGKWGYMGMNYVM